MSDRPSISHCPICLDTNFTYQFTHADLPIVRCDGCTSADAQPSAFRRRARGHLRRRLFPWHERQPGARPLRARVRPGSNSQRPPAISSESSTMRDGIVRTRRGRRLLDLGTGLGNLLVEARDARLRRRRASSTLGELGGARQRAARRTTSCVQGTVETVGARGGTFDVCVLADVIEHTRDPLACWSRVWRVARPWRRALRGDAEPRQLVGAAACANAGWSSRPSTLFYFDSRDAANRLLVRAGFDKVRIDRGRKTLSPGLRASSTSSGFRCRSLSPLGRAGRRRAAERAAPAPPMRVVASGIDVRARRAALPVDRRQAAAFRSSCRSSTSGTRSPMSSTQLARASRSRASRSRSSSSRATRPTARETRCASVEGHPGVQGDLRRSGRAARATPCAPDWRTRPATSS